MMQKDLVTLLDALCRFPNSYAPSLFFYLVNPLSMTAVRARFEGIQYSALGGAFWNN